MRNLRQAVGLLGVAALSLRRAEFPKVFDCIRKRTTKIRKICHRPTHIPLNCEFLRKVMDSYGIHVDSPMSGYTITDWEQAVLASFHKSA